MVDLKKPGILLTFGDDDTWYIKADNFEDVQAVIVEIKDKIVGGSYKKAVSLPYKITAADRLELENLELSEISRLLCDGITIRPAGR